MRHRPPSGVAAAQILAPSALLALSAVPMAAGIARLTQLTAGDPAKAEDVRFFEAPAPAILHITSAVAFCALGAFQFSRARVRPMSGWHMVRGRLLVPCGFAAALSGLWITCTYPPVSSDSTILHGMRLVVGSTMAVFLLFAVRAIGRRDFRAHVAWMIRGYAIGQGAGTQVLTHLPWLLLVGAPGPMTRAALMGAGWLINIVAAEWIIRRRCRLGFPLGGRGP